MKLDEQRFLDVIDAAPLVAVDLVIRNEQGKVLLGKRMNKPAQDFWFVPGGRIRKNERIADAVRRVSNSELGAGVEEGEFLGAFDHIYQDNFLGREGINTHYVAIAYACTLNDRARFTVDSQHSELRWWDVRELLNSNEVHENTKAYFRPRSRK